VLNARCTRSEAGKEAIIVAATSTEAATVEGESYAGDDGKVDSGIVGEQGACGLKDVKGALTKGGCHFAEFEVVTDNSREEDTFAFNESMTDKVVCVNLIRKRMVEQDSASSTPTWVLLQASGDERRQGNPLLNGTGCLAASDFLS
jgi:hypothetical protein